MTAILLFKKIIGLIVLVIGSFATALLWSSQHFGWSFFIGLITLSNFIEMMKRRPSGIYDLLAVLIISTAFLSTTGRLSQMMFSLCLFAICVIALLSVSLKIGSKVSLKLAKKFK